MNAAPVPDWLRAVLEQETGDSLDYLARHSHSFRYAARFLTPPYDTRVADVYAFCRFTDDLVDRAEETDPGILRERLEQWRALASSVYRGIPAGLPLLDRPLLEMARCRIPFAYASSLIDGVAMDLAPRAYESLEELEEYTYRVASVVGLWLTELVGERDPWMLARARDLGHAMQITNILRDVGDDWRMGRLYLPRDVLRRHGIAEADLEAFARGTPPTARWKNAMEELIASAEQRYARALEAVHHLPGFFQRPILVSALVYRDIHGSLRRNGHDNFTRRARTSLARKAWLGVKARVLLWRAARAGRTRSSQTVPA
jgi:phytoene synthase